MADCNANGDMQWRSYHFNELDNTQLYALLRLRIDVFVVEQQCPYPELDGKDCLADTQHLLGYKNDVLLAYARVLAPGVSYVHSSIGRVAVSQNARGDGTGHKLMKEAINLCRKLWPQESIDIGAQAYLKKFYMHHGFIPFSEVYLEDGIEHIDMRRLYSEQ